ncbi:MAG: signal peptidase I [Spirochaetaceae bacterium]|nr:signal peptidase I [Spirochaetaceae bacterium]
MKKAIFAALFCALTIKLFFFDFILASGRSMSPAIESGQILIVNKLSYGLRLPGGYLMRWAEPKPGDIVVFWTPYGDLAVKRTAELTCGGCFVALGDNADYSFDSRNYGPVNTRHIVGKVAAPSRGRGCSLVSAKNMTGGKTDNRL